MDKHIIRCSCGHLEYDDNAMWLNGGPWCRDCYKEKYEKTYNKKYSYDELDYLPKPTEDMYNKQELFDY